MWTAARTELRELVRLTHEVATFDAQRAAKPSMKVTEEAIEARNQKQDRRLQLMDKYELTDGWSSRG